MNKPASEVPKLAEKAVFPIFGKTLAQQDPETGTITVIGGTGMTLLEHYAGLAMQGLCASSGHKFKEVDHLGVCARVSIGIAQALIAELEKVQTP